MPELQLLKMLICPRARRLQNRVNFSIFTNLKLFTVFIINGSTILFSKHGKIEKLKSWVGHTCWRICYPKFFTMFLCCFTWYILNLIFMSALINPFNATWSESHDFSDVFRDYRKRHEMDGHCDAVFWSP